MNDSQAIIIYKAINYKHKHNNIWCVNVYKSAEPLKKKFKASVVYKL